MKSVAVVNPRAGGYRVKRRWQRLQRLIDGHFGPVQAQFTSRPGEATHLAREAIRAGAERIVVVGGDGTINEAVNGFVDEAGESILNPAVTLAVCPVGTGCDFARSIGFAGVPLDVALQRSSERPIDLGRVEFVGRDGRNVVRHFLNISSFGASGTVVQKVNQTRKLFGSRLSFVIGTLRGMAAYANQRVRLQLDAGPEQDVLVNTVAVANGRYFGGSMKVAPEARLNDGLFDVVRMGDIGVGTFVRHGHLIYKGRHLTLPQMRCTRAARVVATPVDGQVLLDLDGEQPGRLPATFEVRASAIKLLAPWDRADAA